MTQDTVNNGLREERPFEEHLLSSVWSLRGAILELLGSVGADPNRPQEVARRFGLRSGLTWKVCKVAQESGVEAVVAHLPGSTGLKLFCDAFERAGAPAAAVRATRDAGQAFERMVEIHTGDRTTLETMIGSMSPATGASEQSRKLAFQGNSGNWGVRATAQLSLNILAPSRDDPTECDLVQIGGLLGFRRLRREARWLLFRCERWTEHALRNEPLRSEPLDADSSPPNMPLIRRFCSKPLPEVEVIAAAGEDQFELPPGPVGNTAAMDCVYGLLSRRVGPAYAEGDDENSDLGVNLITPVEHVLLDLLVHRDFEWAMRPQVALCSRLDGGAIYEAVRRERNVVPLTEQVQDLGWGSSALATSLMPKYPSLLRYAFERVGWDAGAFRAFRFSMQYPPIPTVALLRSPLPVMVR